jgi:hypothetical protein
LGDEGLKGKEVPWGKRKQPQEGRPEREPEIKILNFSSIPDGETSGVLSSMCTREA